MLKNILAFIQGKQKPLLQAIVLTFPFRQYRPQPIFWYSF